MKRVLCLLEEGFEEIEAVTPVDLLRRAGVEVLMAGVSSLQVTGKCGIRVLADDLLGSVSGGEFDAVFLPGGPAVMALRGHREVVGLIRDFHSSGKLVAAICAAPLLLKDAGVIGERRVTAHFSVSGELPQNSGARIEFDGKLLTSRGAGTAVDFGLAFVEALCGKDAAQSVGEAVMV